MEAVLLVIHLIVAMGIIIVVLIQPSESGGFLGSGGSMSNMMAPRRQADLLTRVTSGLGACFFVTSLLLAIMAGNRPAQKSILDAMPAAAVEQKKTETVPAAKVEKKSETPTAPVSK